MNHQEKPHLSRRKPLQDTTKTRRSEIEDAFKVLQAKYPGIELKKSPAGWQVVIPDKYKESHEEHFAQVTENFLNYLQKKAMPGECQTCWPNILPPQKRSN